MRPTGGSSHHLKRYAKGMAPVGYPAWRYKHIQTGDQGNNAADALANKWAECHTVLIDKVQHIIDLVNNLLLIQNRMISVTTLLPQRPHKVSFMPKQEARWWFIPTSEEICQRHGPGWLPSVALQTYSNR